MFVGHAFLALALGLLVGRLAALDEQEVLALGLLVAGSAVLPDLDLVVTVGSIGSVLGDSVTASWDGYWQASNAIHRDVSHTLVGGTGTGLVLAGAALGTRAIRARRPGWMGAGAGLALGGLVLPLVVLGPAVDAVGWAGYAVVLLGALLVGGAVAMRSTLGPTAILGGGLAGQWLHPFTDAFLGEPPRMFYPLDNPVLRESIVFASDSTLNLLGVAGAELAAIWVGVLATSWVRGRWLREVVDRVAVVGIGFPLVMAVLPRPTMASAHWLGFPLAPLALVGLVPVLGEGRKDPDWQLRAVATGLATLTIATGAYGLVVLIGS
jgi:hypothetical protein